MNYEDMTKEELIIELISRDEKDRYNGWSNRETWAFHLWMTNEEGAYNTFKQMAEEAYENALNNGSKYLTTEELACLKMAEYLEHFFEMLGDLVAESKDVRMMLDDIGSTWRIDFREVAEHAIDELVQEKEMELEQ